MVPSTERVVRASRVMPTYAQFPFDQWAETRYRPGARRGVPSKIFDRRARSAAIGIVNVLFAMQDANRAASEDDSEDESAIDYVRKIVLSYNNLREQMKDAGTFLSPNVPGGIELQVEASEYDRLGVRLAEDGSLELDEDAFRERFGGNEAQALEALSDGRGLPAALKEATNRYIGVPVSQLLNDKLFDTKLKPGYPPRLHAGLRLSMTGILLDMVM
ncbi:hypothetical protein [Cohnella panacarvi]|uniref:hypothetical protein n=1 Tax=Cohnella panacarvi TaxID=400776 RepID=UPI00047C4964|nr:hypothetical protein [Cohnella panacarvi]